MDLAAFLYQAGTLYLIAETRGDDAPVAPLFACLASEIHHTAALLGSPMPGGRLDPPLLMALDEVTQICPVPSRPGPPTPAARETPAATDGHACDGRLAFDFLYSWYVDSNNGKMASADWPGV